jgi:phosphoribosylformimino-5-aminoimidazole carboxamide ribotide isomerase
LGAARAILGTAAIEDPGMVSECAKRWPHQIAVGLDYSVSEDGGMEARAHGWLSGSGASPIELLAGWKDDPIAAVIATSIARDGMLQGTDLAGLTELLNATSVPVIASGGVGSLDDLTQLAALRGAHGALHGAIVGKALVEGRFSVEEAVTLCAASA